MDSPAERLEQLKQELAQKPDDVYVNYELGNLLIESSRPDLAVKLLTKAAQLTQGNTDAFNALGNALRVNRHYRDAETAYLQAILKASHAERAVSNLSSLEAELGHYQRSGLLTHIAYQLNADFHQSNWLLAMYYLRYREYDRAWHYIHKREELDPQAVGIKNKLLPEWDGSYVPLLLQREQGIGDFIQYSRYLPMIQMKVPRLVVQTPPGLSELMQANFPKIEFVENPSNEGLSARIAMFDLHKVIAMGVQDISGKSYLKALPLKKFKIDRQHPKPFIGVVWSGNPSHKNDRNRSIEAKEFARIFERFDGTVLIIQKPPRKGEISEHLQCSFVDISDKLNDWSDTAAVLSKLDAIVSVDTSVAHLGGALGVPTHTLIPRSPDWRWGIDRADSLWYDSMILHRQDKNGSWDNAFQTVSEMI